MDDAISFDETVEAYAAAYQDFKPFEEVVSSAVAKTFAVIKEIGKEYHLYNSNWKFGEFFDSPLKFANLHPSMFTDSRLYFEECDASGKELYLDYETINNPSKIVTDAAKAEVAARASLHDDYKKNRREKLLAELAELDNN